MEARLTAWDGFQAGIGIVLTVLKAWLAAALCLTLAAAAAGANPVVALMLAVITLAAVVPFVRVSWVSGMRAGLGEMDARSFRVGLITALCVSILALWLGMLTFALVTSGAAPGGAASVPGGLNLAAGALALVSTLLGLAALVWLHSQPRD